MTTYADVQSQFLSILNRRDVTQTQINTFFQNGALRINRGVRLPVMEALVQFTIGTRGVVSVPPDMLELIAIYTNDCVNNDKLERGSLPELLKLSRYPGVPKKFYRQGTDFIIGPSPKPGTVFWVSYYASAATLVNPTDTNWCTLCCQDLLLYAALSMCSDTFMDDRAQAWEAKYVQIAESYLNQAQQDDLVGASVSPAYNSDGYDRWGHDYW